MSTNTPSLRPCPLCQQPAVTAFRPFCSRGCRDRDLNQWFDEGYRIPAAPPADEGEDYDGDRSRPDDHRGD
jgi:uncharacterized protein